MTVKITKPALNLREELNKLDKPSGITGESLLRADTAADAKKTLGIDSFDQISVSTDGVISADGLNLGDSDKIQLGDSNDLQIYHNGSQSFLTDVGTGNLYIQAADNVFIDHYGGTGRIATLAGGGVQIKYDGVTKLQSTSSGIDVTGEVSADLLKINSGTSNEVARFTSTDASTSIQLIDSGGNGYLQLTNGLLYYKSNDNGSGSSGHRFYNSGSEVARIDSSGSLGLGTSSPSAPLSVGSVSGDTYAVFDNGAKARLTFNGDASAAKIFSTTTGFANYEDLEFRADNYLFKTGTTERMRIASNGKVGIGTSSPLESLDVRGKGYFNNGGALYVDSQSSGVLFAATGASRNIAFEVNGARRFDIKPDGNVGIGTTSPSQKLHLQDGQTQLLVEGTNTSVSNLVAGVGVKAQYYRKAGFTIFDESNNEDFFIGRPYGSTNQFAIINDGNERLRISAAGNVGIGTSSIARPLTVNGLIGSRNSTTGFGASDGFDIGVGGSDAYLVQRENANIIIETNGAERMRVDSSGNLLVGTTTAANTNAGFRAYSGGDIAVARASLCGVFNRLTSNGTVLSFQKDGTSVGNISSQSGDNLRVTFSGDGDQYITGNGAANYLSFSTGNGERGRFDNSGKFMVGTSQSNVYNSSSAQGSILANDHIQVAKNGGTVAYFNRNTSDGAIIELRRAGANVGSIGINNNDVYIGTGDTSLTFVDGSDAINPTGANGAQRSDAVSLGDANNRFKDLYLSGDAYLNQIRGTSDADTKIKFVGSDVIKFDNGGTESARIDSLGRFLVGKTSASATGSGTELRGTQVIIGKTSSGTVNGIYFNHNSSYVGGLNYTDSATSLVTSSDQRLKENIEDANDAGSKIDAMQVRQFDWKENGSHQEYGFVAQELEPVFGHAVHTAEDEQSTKGVDYASLVPMLVKEIQSLRARVAQLEGAN